MSENGAGLFEEQPVECFQCGGVYPRRELRAIQELPGYRWPRYCAGCADAIQAAHTRRCLLCGDLYMARLPGDLDGLCSGCSSRGRLRELARVRYHLERAAVLGLPATLTLKQWLAAVAHFGGKCAYCLARPYTDLDHFVPLAAGGGTTSGNCVPACAQCNALKHAADPNRMPLAPPPGPAVARVRAYLTTQR